GTPPQGGPSNGAPGARTAGGDTAIVDVTEATIQSDVLERSMATPVVVFFGAAGFPESDEFAPVLERLNAESGGTWVLARVDVQENPRIAQMFRVQGIPMVYAVVGGQPVDAFSGVVPEAQLRQWLQAVLKAGGVAVAEPEDPRLDEADDALMSGDLDAAEQAYRKILADAPADAAATAGLAQVGVARRVAGADPSTALAAAESAPDDVAAQLLAADIEVLSGLAEQAYARLVGLVRRTAGEDRETVRQHLVSLFSIAGPDDPAVASARRALASALF
ncbi:tetratricopeptide repeat protein, partial [Micromonospora ureilytica]|uniref:tetratricopeptide repeat protein n=1 Tax=Micromonospora ureilytica TaxID=709868 RepID=UPI00197BF3C9